MNQGRSSERNILLEPFVSQLQGVEIKAGKFDRPIEEQTVSMEIIKADLIEAKNTQNIQTILDYTPGLNILDNEPQIRGGSGFTFGVGSKVAVLVDDMPMTVRRCRPAVLGFCACRKYRTDRSDQRGILGAFRHLCLKRRHSHQDGLPGDKPLTKVTVFSGAYSPPADKAQKWWNDYPYISRS